MKKSFSGLLIIAIISLAFTTLLPNPTFAKTKVASTKKHKVVAKIPTTMPWDTKTMRSLQNLAGFDYSTAIRNSYIKKVETYAKKHHIKIITEEMIESAQL